VVKAGEALLSSYVCRPGTSVLTTEPTMYVGAGMDIQQQGGWVRTRVSGWIGQSQGIIILIMDEAPLSMK
jgi:hypothetical protein